MNGKTKRYADLIDGVLELAKTGLSSEDYTALLDELKRDLVFPKQCPMAAPGIPCTYAHRHHGPHSWEKSEPRPMSGSDIIREVASLAWEEMETKERLGHLKPPLGRPPFCAYDKCDNPPTTPGRYCGVHDDPNKAPGSALDPALSPRQTQNVAHRHKLACDDPSKCPSGDAYANAPSGNDMLLDGPMPTPIQVAHLRNLVLAEAKAAADTEVAAFKKAYAKASAEAEPMSMAATFNRYCVAASMADCIRALMTEPK